MAQHNIVHLYGTVQTEPNVTIDDETGKPIAATLYLTVTNSARKVDGVESPPEIIPVRVRATSAETTCILAKAKLNDMVVIKGVVSTKNVIKQITCKECGQRFSANSKEDNDSSEEATGMITYVTPIAVDIMKSNLTEEEAMKHLLMVREMSNEVQLIGNLCADPKAWDNGKATAYQLGVNRKFYQIDDDPSIHADYPYVRAVGNQAENDIEALSKGSLVLVDGYLKMRYFDRKNVCPYCGATRTWTDYAMETVPYSVEYLANFKTGKERLAEKEAQLEAYNF